MALTFMKHDADSEDFLTKPRNMPSMIANIAADGVMLLHLMFVLFVVFGALLVMRFQWLVFLHLPAVAWGAFIELSGGICPLTYVENDLRDRAGSAGLETGFIEHYIYSLLYPPGLTRNVQLILAAFVICLNAALYAWILARRRSKQADRNAMNRRVK
jgi:hypothetical protein